MAVPDRHKRNPTILVPYEGPCDDQNAQDVFIALRPEANGVMSESAILRIICREPEYKQKIKLIYLANIPNDVFRNGGHFESYYALKLHFALQGKEAFTPTMQERFSEYFKTDFDKAEIVGGFEAQDKLGMSSEELFQVWVDDPDNMMIFGQTIKRYHGYYIVNYDIPALARRRHFISDFAVMLFRINLPYEYFADIAQRIWRSLLEEGIVKDKRIQERSFHYSHSPLEQIRDGMCFLYKTPREVASTADISFGKYLRDHGVGDSQIRHMIKFPLATLADWPTDGAHKGASEVSLFDAVRFDSFEETFDALQHIVSQPYIKDYDTILDKDISV